MKRIATIIEKGRVTGLVHGPDACSQTITVNGRIWHFDFDERGGPIWLKADGTTPRKNQHPNAAVWSVWAEWQKSWSKKKPKAPKAKPALLKQNPAKAGKCGALLEVARSVAGHIRKPYSDVQIAAFIKSGDYSSELIMQHLLLLSTHETNLGRTTRSYGPLVNAKSATTPTRDIPKITEQNMANQTVKIMDEFNGVTRVTEASGRRRGYDMFIDHGDLGEPETEISVPEFWLENFDGDAAKTYYGEVKK